MSRKHKYISGINLSRLIMSGLVLLIKYINLWKYYMHSQLVLSIFQRNIMLNSGKPITEVSYLLHRQNSGFYLTFTK